MLPSNITYICFLQKLMVEPKAVLIFFQYPVAGPGNDAALGSQDFGTVVGRVRHKEVAPASLVVRNLAVSQDDGLSNPVFHCREL